ncbi:YqzM family protein [Paenibacillus sp. JTLBN-2024]
MDANVHANDPREHVNEEPRNDLMDLMNGFGGMALFMTLIFAIMVIIKFVISGSTCSSLKR